MSLPMVLGLVVAVLARSFFSFLGLTGTSGSHVAVFARAFVLTRLSILGLISLALPPFLRLRSGAFEGLRLAVLRLACLGLLRPILSLACFVLTLALLGLNRPILRLSLALLRLSGSILRLSRAALWCWRLPILGLALLRLPCLALLWLD